MKKIFFFFALLISLSSQAQIRVCQLPQVMSGTLNDYIIKEDSTCVGTRKMKISDFIATYSLGGGTSIDTTSLSNRINTLTNSKVDTIYKNSTRDSIVFTISGRRHAIKDSTGSASLTPPANIVVTQADAEDMEVGTTTFPVENQWYTINTLGITGIAEIRTIGVIDNISGNGRFNPNAEAYVEALARYVPCTYDVTTNILQFDYLLWAGHLTQAGTAAPTIDQTNYNISTQTPILDYVSEGVYTITFSDDRLVDGTAVKHFSFIYEGGQQGFYTIEGVSSNIASIKCFRGGAAVDDRLNSAYIEIRLIYTP